MIDLGYYGSRIAVATFRTGADSRGGLSCVVLNKHMVGLPHIDTHTMLLSSGTEKSYVREPHTNKLNVPP